MFLCDVDSVLRVPDLAPMLLLQKKNTHTHKTKQNENRKKYQQNGEAFIKDNRKIYNNQKERDRKQEISLLTEIRLYQLLFLQVFGFCFYYETHNRRGPVKS